MHQIQNKSQRGFIEYIRMHACMHAQRSQKYCYLAFESISTRGKIELAGWADILITICV